MTTTIDLAAPRAPRTSREYQAAVAEMDRLLDLEPRRGTEEFDRLELLAILVEAYEAAHVPELPRARPTEVVDFVLEQSGRDRASLAPILGGRSRVSEFFSGQRPLSMSQVRALRRELGIPADLLID
jgi:HTH-type transcriptional regulator/antitoxin HigA